MKLSLYLKDTSISVAQFAKLLGVARVTVYDYLNGKKKPSSENMTAIVKITNSLVTPNDFYELPKLKRRTKAEEGTRQGIT